LVNNYLQLRTDDALIALYARTVASYEKALLLTQSQLRAGVVTPSDVALADATLQAARAQATDIGLARKQLEHAIAVLLGKTPSEFAIAPWSDALRSLPSVPQIPSIVPSALLERRPDIAGAERRVAMANANIGVAQSAWFPTLALAASYGNSGPKFGDWLAAPYRVWALGAQLGGTIFDGGLRASQDQQAQAAFDAAASNYRQIVLASFQEVEDNLAALNDLTRERAQQDAAVASAKTAERIITSQYRAGTTLYLSVVTAQALTLSNERAALQVQGRLLAASVALIKATGGSWNTATN
jgi:NodT family efflux transporter outer membrane factor (OMF) lipoprotein